MKKSHILCKVIILLLPLLLCIQNNNTCTHLPLALSDEIFTDLSRFVMLLLVGVDAVVEVFFISSSVPSHRLINSIKRSSEANKSFITFTRRDIVGLQKFFLFHSLQHALTFKSNECASNI